MLILAVLAILAGAFLVWIQADDQRRARLVSKTPTTRIADAEPGVRVEIKGRAEADEEGTLAAPGVDAPALYYNITVYEERTEKGKKDWHGVAFCQRSVPFLVDDGSGRRARIVPAGANVEIGSVRRVEREVAACDMPPEVRTVVETEGFAKLTAKGTDRVKYVVAAIAPGDAVYALGFGEVAMHGNEAAPYRGGATAVLVMRGDSEGKRELLVSNRSEADLVAYLRIGCFWPGIFLVVAGIAVAIWQLLTWR